MEIRGIGLAVLYAAGVVSVFPFEASSFPLDGLNVWTQFHNLQCSSIAQGRFNDSIPAESGKSDGNFRRVASAVGLVQFASGRLSDVVYV